MTVEEVPTKSLSFEEIIDLVKKKDYEGFRNAIKMDDFDINKTDFRGVTALHYAAELNDVELIVIITAHPKINLNSRTNEIMSTPLMIAAGNGKYLALKCLLEKGASTTCVNAYGYTALMVACEALHVECVKLLLNHDKTIISWANSDNRTALMLGINSYEIVKEFIKVSDPFNFDYGFGYNLLHLAAESCTLEVVKLILDYDLIDINAQNYKSETALHVALRYSDLDVADLLIENGASLSIKGEDDHSSYAYAALYDDSESFLEKYEIEKSDLSGMINLLAANGRAKILEKYLKKFPLYYATRCILVYAALMAAAENGHLDCMKLLFTDIDDEIILIRAVLMSIEGNNYGCFEFAYNELLKLDNADEVIKGYREGVLHLVFTSGNVQICKFFLDQGVCPDGDDETTYLIMACSTNNVELVSLLLSHGADVNSLHSKYGSALILAATNNNLEIVKLLLKNGADPFAKDSEGFTALLSAAYFNCEGVFFELFSVDKNLRYRSRNGTTPFLAACIGCNLNIIKVLIENGASLTECDYGNSNCLYLAASNKEKSLEVLIYLFKLLHDETDFRSMLSAKDEHGFTPLHYIINQNDQRMIFSLIAANPKFSNYLLSPVDHKIQSESGEMCLICRDDFELDEVATKLPCKHLFHGNCFNEWSLKKPNCPYCQGFSFKIK